MSKRMIFVAYVLYLHCCIIYAYYDAVCPSEQLWHLRANSICSSVRKYTCLLDYVHNIYKEDCSGPKTEPPGDKTVVNSGNFDTKPCSNDRFQPFSFATYQGNDCIFKKIACNDEGQIVNSNGTSRSNRECRCDYTKSFSFLSTNRKNRCSCDPTMEDCSCFRKTCGNGEILSPDYKCINKGDSYGLLVCEEIDITQLYYRSQPTYSTLDEVEGSDIRKPITKGTGSRIASITLMTAILISVFIVFFLNPWIPDKIAKILKIDKNIVQDSEHMTHSSSFNCLNQRATSKSTVNSLSHDSFKSADDNLSKEKTKSDISRSYTHSLNGSLGSSETRQEYKLGDNNINGPGTDRKTTKSQDTFTQYINKDIGFKKSDRQSQKSESQGSSPETKLLSYQTKEDSLIDFEQDIISETSVNTNLRNSHKTAAIDSLKDTQTTDPEDDNKYTIPVAKLSDVSDANKRKVRSHKHDQYDEDLIQDKNSLYGIDKSNSLSGSKISHTSATNDLINGITTTDQKESKKEPVVDLQPSCLFDENPMINDQNMTTEADQNSYRMHKALLDKYKYRPYEQRVLNDLIKDGTIETYDSPKNMTEFDAVQKDEAIAIENLIQKFRNDYTIRRRGIEPQQATVMEELTKWAKGELTKLAGGKFQKIIDWVRYQDTEKK
ncbi:uncharacterized protein LOC127711525 [Mytilus californianus]|uniref:uncharacterized protein LOC127711525 n=1 Tax=Mytilus californianus TaxID=6549 RepID=UPI002246C79E|nr:uncharacterized protein LOC127711525 [Mytilus californianus]